MDADKQKALEAAGWQVGSADDFLAGAPIQSEATMTNNQMFRPPLDLPAPEGKEAEWALLRLAELFGVERKHETWDELANAIAAAKAATPPTT